MQRPQACTKDGDKRYAIVFPKAKAGDYSVKEVKVPCTYGIYLQISLFAYWYEFGVYICDIQTKSVLWSSMPMSIYIVLNCNLYINFLEVM